MLSILKPLFVFFLAGLCEIGGGYLMWQWLKADRPGWMGAAVAVPVIALPGAYQVQETSLVMKGLCDRCAGPPQTMQ